MTPAGVPSPAMSPSACYRRPACPHLLSGLSEETSSLAPLQEEREREREEREREEDILIYVGSMPLLALILTCHHVTFIYDNCNTVSLFNIVAISALFS